ncbi:hypothetical protein KIN20_001261 [Parelaphostrongylus tenuis]|uniref:Uncharacterized protein n=1 Tax=Parelaphostrongylus tenuis TaxID=148309 RepID=A0AAD5MEZ6_PARTN|nr:hypothetical protein KIN20_001261 [Parelaphostrongylus tenuis]
MSGQWRFAATWIVGQSQTIILIKKSLLDMFRTTVFEQDDSVLDSPASIPGTALQQNFHLFATTAADYCE